VAPRPRSSSAATREPRPTRTESQAKNEELFRNVNERIESLSQTVASNDEAMEYLCECDRPDCYGRVKASREERFLVVEKQGAAALEALENDPRP
jgi:hypothetical protein